MTLIKPDVQNAIDNHLANNPKTTGLHILAVSEVTRGLIEATIEHTYGNQQKAAKILGINRTTLRQHLTKYRTQR
ncbi:helix-turn-helix domain-containing protein [Photobacterium indicum]|uniref:helix-turn-helix domain-containing protein n=1 Tax=Photobacterium indicum TaxID=81447 RepID=UPI003D0E95E1